LHEALLGVEYRGGSRARVTLPGLLERLGRGDPVDLTGVQAHQQHAVHAFLVQVAAMAVHRSWDDRQRRSESAWRAALLELSGGSREAWCLIVPDLSQPAFLQAPVPEGSLDPLPYEHLAPVDELDVLVTAKGHDVKARRPRPNDPELWAYALIALQTTQGYFGSGNYGVSRMNGGHGSRPGVGLAPDVTLGGRFARDTAVLLGARPATVRRHGYRKAGGLCLTWTVPWDGRDSLPLHRLDPYHVEICRRMRLVEGAGGSIVARRGNSRAPRLAAAERGGDVGDPWIPVSAATGKALTVTAAGWTYGRLAEVLFSARWRRAPALEAAAADGAAPVVVARVLVRGQGETGGYHERIVSFPARARRILEDPVTREHVAGLVERWLALASAARSQILHVALCTLLQGGPENLRLDDGRTRPWLDALEQDIDGEFFSLLFEHGESAPEVADRAFQSVLAELVRRQLEAAIHAAPVPVSRRPRAIAHAEKALGLSLRRLFRELRQATARPLAPPDPGGPQEAPLLAPHPQPRPTVAFSVEHVVRAFCCSLRSLEVAHLKKLDPTRPDVPAFFRLLAGPLAPALAVVPPERRTVAEARWAAVVATLAHTFPLHRRGACLGDALVAADVREHRVLRLLQAHDAALFALLRPVTHQLARRRTPFDALLLAELVLSDGEPREERVRRRIARSYFRAAVAGAPR